MICVSEDCLRPQKIADHNADVGRNIEADKSAYRKPSAEAALGLSDVLYQEQKYEESAAVLNKLSTVSKQ